MLVSASFLDSKQIPFDLTKLNETDADYIHVDVMDGKYVKNKSLPFRELKNIYKYTSKRLDVHLMVKNPLKYIDDYATLNTEYITIHLDVSDDVLKTIKKIKSYSIKAGIALNPDTDIKDLIPYLPYIDLILVMGVIPGKGGQKFIDSTIDKLKELMVLKKEYPTLSFKISVDGGINKDTRGKIKDMADIVVSGNYILTSHNFQQTIDILR